MTNQVALKVCAILFVTALIGLADENGKTSVAAHRALDGIYRVMTPDFEGFTQVQLVAYVEEGSENPWISVIVIKVASNGEKPTIEQFQARMIGNSIVGVQKNSPTLVVSEKKDLVFNGNVTEKISEN
jgi:hypothetical protein